jgi:hypothetical protein
MEAAFALGIADLATVSKATPAPTAAGTPNPDFKSSFAAGLEEIVSLDF